MSKLVPQTEIAPVLGVSISWLEKDRITRQLVPFYRIGGKVLYDPDQARAAMEAHRVGGPPAPKPKKRSAGVAA